MAAMTPIRSLANLARRLWCGAMLALLSVSAAVPTGCAEVAPFVVPAVTCAQQNIPVADVKRAMADLWAHNWSDLEELAKVDGWPTVACIIGQAVKANPQLQPAASEFRRLYAVEFRAAEAQGASLCSPKPYTVALAPAGGVGPAGGGGARLHAASMRGAAPPTPVEAPKGGDRR